MGCRPITRRHVGELLYDDFEPFSQLPSKLLSVFSDKAGSELILNCDCGGLYFRAEANDNTLVWNDGRREDFAVNHTDQAPWAERIGTDIDFMWATVNKQGYMDGALLSFGAKLPSLVLNVRESAIHVAAIGSWTEVGA